MVSLDLSSNFGLEVGSLKGLVQYMINLKELHLSYVNIASSALPRDLLSNFSSLESLDLYECGLKGEFPVAIFNLPKLNLSGNRDIKGHLPNFHSGSPLKSLRLDHTSFGGVLPPSIGNLASLEEIELNHCNFTGKLPKSLGNLAQLVSLDCSNIWDGNHFNSDSLTTSSLSWIGELTNLTKLTLGGMNLTRLTHLYINDNQLIGTIPSWLVTLPRLQFIDLSHNKLTGPIPTKFNHQIEYLDLSSNNLEGYIPTNLSTLYNLSLCSLEHNRLVGSVELNLFCHLQNLHSLFLSYNKLSLTIKNISTKNVSCFPSLRHLKLASCNLSEFSTHLHNNKSTLEELDLSDNNLRGLIPSWVLESSQDTNYGIVLNLSYNLLTGFERIHPRAKINTLDLRNNMLQGPLPIPPPSSSSFFSSYLISNNNLSGQVSNLICNFTSLRFFDLSFNGLSGKLPQCLSNLSDSLSLLELRKNKFDGNIPSTWRNGCGLRMISMSHNMLQGELPRSLANCTSLEFVDFSNNQISDTFPYWLGRITPLSVLILRSNTLNGIINDDGDYGFSNLRVIDLSKNNFKGKLPSKLIDTSNPMRSSNASHTLEYMEHNLQLYAMGVYEDFSPFDYSMTIYNKGSEMSYPKILHNFYVIDFSSNNFEGQIPDAFGETAGLHLLNLSRNHLGGHIPSSFSNMKSLECLDLSQNKLSGQIPIELAELNFLSLFNMSYNNLSGPIPQGKQFCTYDSTSYEGNPRLFIEPWSKQCGNARSLPQMQQPLSPSNEDDDSESGFKIEWMIISIRIVGGLVVRVILGNELIARKQYWFAKTLARIGIR